MTASTTSTTTGSTTIADVIDVSDFRRMLAEEPDLRVLDVRSGGEFETVHIPGSYNVPLETLGEHAADLADVDHPVVLVCQSGGRATKAHGALRGKGKETVHILEGGMNAWEAAGGDVLRSANQRWAMDRQVRFTAGTISLIGILTSIFFPKAKWLAGGVASGLVFSAVTDTCAMAQALSKLPYNRTDKCDIAGVLRDMQGPSASNGAAR